MRHYKVEVDSVTGKSGKIFRRGVQLRHDELIDAFEDEKKGFIEFIFDDLDEPKKPEPEEKRIEDFTRGYLMDKLKEAGIKFSPNSSKVELFEEWKKL